MINGKNNKTINILGNNSFSTAITNKKSFKEKLKLKMKEKNKQNNNIIINNGKNNIKFLNPNYYNLENQDYDGFILKSYSEDDIHKSIKYGVWSSTKEGNKILNNIFIKNINNEKKNAILKPIFLFFSVNKSSIFNGMAIMKSKVNFDIIFKKWMSKRYWQGLFRVEWVFIKDLDYNTIKYIKNGYNNKYWCESRDCTKISKCNINFIINEFINLKNYRSIIEDYKYYDDREKKI